VAPEVRKQTMLLLAGSESSSASKLLGQRVSRHLGLFTTPTPDRHRIE
jgi:hypothetical protein